jgi:hypothetical protein
LHCILNCNFRHFIFANLFKNHLIIKNFQYLFNATKKMYYTFFGGIRFWTQGFALVKQVLYCLSHTSSSHLRDDLDFENLLFWQLSVVPYLFLKQLSLFILYERMKIDIICRIYHMYIRIAKIPVTFWREGKGG